MRTYSVTYEIVTPESAEDGEFAETGFLEQDTPLEPDIFDADEYGSESAAAVEMMLKIIPPYVERGNISSWYEVDSDIDYRTSAETRRAWHLKGFTSTELEQIAKRLK